MRLPIFLVLLAGAAEMQAAPVPVTSDAYLHAAVVVGAFDRLAGECAAAGGFAPEQRRRIDDWHATHGVDRIRARLPELDAYPAQRQQLAQPVDQITSQLAAQGFASCPAAASVTRLPFAQFASVAPELPSDAVPVAAASPPPTAAAPAGAALADTSVATTANRGARRGRHRIDGLALVIDYDDGGSERRVLVMNPNEPNGALWLDGEAYVQRD
ncbi:MAG: hypothetical protein AB7I32_15945 [Gammaproteobacteria bacterium]